MQQEIINIQEKFSKESIKGLEFTHGASMAIDSLSKQNIPLDVYVYDTKSARESISSNSANVAADGVELVIANCSIAELATLARLGADKDHCINATVPNDANTTDNPYFIVLNPTLQTQMKACIIILKLITPAGRWWL